MSFGLMYPGLFLVWCSQRIYRVRLAREKRRAKQAAAIHPKDVDSVMTGLGHVDEPFLYRLGLEFALFRTYAVPTISRLLADTGKLSANPNLRYDVTDLLLREATERDGPRRTKAIQRINAIHAQYGSRISNEDLLFTLCAFIVEPLRWISRFGTRPPLQQEWVASYAQWREIGREMGVKDIPSSLSAVLTFYDTYAEQNMRYDDSSRSIAESTIGLLVSQCPSPLVPLAKSAINALLDDQVRLALKYPPPNPIVAECVYAVLRLRACFLRNFVFPLDKPRFRTPDTPEANSRKMCPRFHLYNTTVPSYVVENVGSAPTGSLLALDSGH